jgi:cytoskeletal protein RodZ
MSSVGDQLRQARLKSGLDLDRIAEQTRINPRYLEAVERNDVDALPGHFFYRSFVRQYAAAVGLDPEDFAADLPRADSPFSMEVPAEPPKQRISVPPLTHGPTRGFHERRWPMSIGILFVVLLGCSGLYSLWLRSRTPPRAETPPIIHEPKTAAAPAAVEPVKPVPPPEEPKPAPAPEAVAEGAFSIDLSATEPAWVRVTSGEKTLFIGTLEPGQARALQSPGPARLRVGNAGGLEVRWNGKYIGPIGPIGQVRDVVFNAEGFQVVAPPPPAPKPEEPKPDAPTQSMARNTATETTDLPRASASGSATNFGQ